MAGFFSYPAAAFTSSLTTATANPLSATVINITVVANTAFQPFGGWTYGDTNGANTYGYVGLIYTAPNPTSVFTPPLSPGLIDVSAPPNWTAWWTGSSDFAGLSSALSGTTLTVGATQDVYLYGADGPTPGPAHNEGYVVRLNVTAYSSVFALTTTSISQSEGHSGSTDYAYTVTRTGDTSTAADITYTVSAGGVIGTDPASPDDFVGGAFPSGTLHFGIGDTTATIHIAVRGDSTLETNEGFSVVLSGAPAGSGIGFLDANGLLIGGGGAAGSSAEGIILNDDWRASITALPPTSQLEGDPPAVTTFNYQVTRTGNISAAGDVTWTVSGNGASPANAADFVTTSGTAHFDAGSNTASFSVSVAADNNVEPDEGFRVTISNPTAGGSILTATATGTILNDDAGFSINDASVTEGDAGTVLITFTITQSGYILNPHSVQWTFVNDAFVPVDTTDFPSQLYADDLPNPPAVKDGYPIFGYLDYATLGTTAPILRDTGIINFAVSDTTHTLTFVVNGDTWLEANDRFHIVLQNPSPGSEIIAGQGDGTGTIGNDDQPGTVGYKGTITGTGGNDSLTAPQQLNGYEFFGGPGNDTLLGYGYDNLVYGADGADSIYGGDGHSMVDGGAGNDSIRMHGYLDTVYGGYGDDSIWGTEGTAQIDAGRGNDRVSFAGNSNLVLGNFGNDTIQGGDHSNTVLGGVGADSISVVGWNNQVFGDDSQAPLAGVNYNDTIFGGDHDNTVWGGYGDDVISFVGQRNVAHGETGNDSIIAGSGYDSVFGEEGNDTVAVSGWGNLVDGGDGTDVIIEPGRRSDATFFFAGGAWNVKFGYNAGSDTILNGEVLRFAGGGADVDISAAALLAGFVQQGDQTGNSTLAGLGGNDTIIGFGYNNSIVGGGGNDSIDAGMGNETVVGGSGANTIVVGGHLNLITGGGGGDLITFTAGRSHNNVVATGGGNDTVTGLGDSNSIDLGTGNDSVVAFGHNNTLSGGDGNDTFVVNGAGADSIDGGSGFDTVIFNFSRFTSEIVANLDGSFSIHGPNGWDTLRNIERAVFTDGVSNLGRGEHGDINGDRLADAVGQNLSWQVAAVQNQFPAPGPYPQVSIATPTNWLLVASSDLNGDGNADLIFQGQPGSGFTGDVFAWTMNGYSIGGGIDYGYPTSPTMALRFAADMTGDAQADLLLRDSATGEVQAWLTDPGGASATRYSLGVWTTFWDVKGLADFNGDGRADILFQGTDGTVYMWLMNGAGIASMGWVGNVGNTWQVRGTGDFDGDGKADILWRNVDDGALYVWEMNGLNIKAGAGIANPGLGQDVATVADFTGDGHADFVLDDGAGNFTVYAMNGFTTLGSAALGNLGTGWHLV
jgi:Ca2+-binding RTX toxin-like protein